MREPAAASDQAPASPAPVPLHRGAGHVSAAPAGSPRTVLRQKSERLRTRAHHHTTPHCAQLPHTLNQSLISAWPSAALGNLRGYVAYVTRPLLPQDGRTGGSRTLVMHDAISAIRFALACCAVVPMPGALCVRPATGVLRPSRASGGRPRARCVRCVRCVLRAARWPRTSPLVRGCHRSADAQTGAAGISVSALRPGPGSRLEACDSASSSGGPVLVLWKGLFSEAPVPTRDRARYRTPGAAHVRAGRRPAGRRSAGRRTQNAERRTQNAEPCVCACDCVCVWVRARVNAHSAAP